MASLEIEWRHLAVAGDTCQRCADTGTALKAALAVLARDPDMQEHHFHYTETTLGPESLAQSNLILINGRALEDWLGAQATSTSCASCGDLVGAAVCCRAVEIEGVNHEAIPEAMIRSAVRAALNKETHAMKHILVLGSGCANCDNTARLIAEIAAATGVAVQIDKVTDIGQILGYGVMSTPGVVIDGQVVHAGGVPSRQMVAEWLR